MFALDDEDVGVGSGVNNEGNDGGLYETTPVAKVTRVSSGR